MTDAPMPQDDKIRYPHQTDEGKRYRMLDDVRREYEATGVVYNTETGLLERGAITKDNAVVMQKASRDAIQEKAIQSARAGLLQGVSATELVSDPLIGWQHINAAQAELAMTPDMGHASTRAAEFVGKTTGYMPDRLQGGNGNTTNVLNVNVPTLEQAQEILDTLVIDVPLAETELVDVVASGDDVDDDKERDGD